MRVAIVGSRKASLLDEETVLKYIPGDCTEIVSGGSGNVDMMAEKIANKHNYLFKCFLPEYKLYGKMAPLLRNIQIIENSDLVLAFWDMKSKGTSFVIKECIKRQTPVKVISIT